MKKCFYSAIAVSFLLFGCGDEKVEVDTLDNGVMPAEVIVEIQTAEQLAVGEPIQLAVKVSQNGEAVNDADEVKFEVWESSSSSLLGIMRHTNLSILFMNPIRMPVFITLKAVWKVARM